MDGFNMQGGSEPRVPSLEWYPKGPTECVSKLGIWKLFLILLIYFIFYQLACQERYKVGVFCLPGSLSHYHLMLA